MNDPEVGRTPRGPVDVFASATMPTVTADRIHDLSLRILTIAVLITLAGCAVFLGWRAAYPPVPKPPVSAPPTMAEALPVRPPDAYTTRALPAPRIMMSPDRMFRCEQRGRVVYSDQACPTGDEKVMAVTGAPARADPAAVRATEPRTVPLRPAAGASQSLQPDTVAPSAPVSVTR